MEILLLAKFLDTLNMMYLAVIQDQHALWGRIRVHYIKQSLKPK
jgi:hypothetical protein